MGTESEDDDQTVTSQVIRVDNDSDERHHHHHRRHHHHQQQASSSLGAAFTVLATATMWVKNHVIPRVFRSNLPLFFWGIMIGVLFTTLFVEHQVMFRSVMTWKRRMRSLDSQELLLYGDGGGGGGNFHKDRDTVQQEMRSTGSDSVPTRGKNRIYVGVLTAKKYLHTRSKAVYETWGRQMDKVNFFVGEQGGDDVTPPPGLPVIFLKDTSDVDYPPQKKMFSMMKHICKYHIDDYEWFARADDDLYIRMKQLKRVISSLDSDRMMYMGQPGKGIPEMRAKIGLDGHNFCMGGPGVFLNKLAMKELCPHLDECEADVASNEEDVEIGRCVTKHLHIECTHNWQTLKLFYHSYSTDYTEDRPFQGNLVENDFLSTAVTLHYFKLPLLMYRVHRHFCVMDHLQTAQELKNLTSELSVTEKKVSGFYKLTQPYLTDLNPPSVFTRANKVKEWRTITLTSQMTSSPAQVVDDLIGDVLVDVRQVGERAIDVAVISGKGGKLEYSHTVNGYTACDAMDGCSYLFDMLFHQKPSSHHQRRRRRKKRKPRSKLRREEEVARSKIALRRVELKREISKSSTAVTQVHFISQDAADPHDTDYYVIIATDGIRSRQFESFMRDVYEVLLLSSPAMTSHTHVIVAPTTTTTTTTSSSSREPLVSEVVEWFKVKHPRGHLVALASSNSTDEAYTSALKWTDAHVSGGGVVLLTTANLHFDVDLLASCRARSRGPAGVPLFYQPLGLHIFPVSTSSAQSSSDEQRGFWDPWIAGGGSRSSEPVAPLCGRLDDFASLFGGGESSSSSLLSDRLYRKLHAGEAELFRAPEPNLSAFLHLIT